MRLCQIPPLVKFAVLIFLTLALVVLAAQSQELGTAVLNGDVTDPQGAVVNGAAVTVENKATGMQRASISKAGLFTFNNLAPGKYELRVEATGFASFVQPVQVEVGQQATLKVRLTVAKQQTTIEINDSDAMQQVNTASSVVDGVVNSHQIDNLPLNGRNFLELALLMPGNTLAPNFDPTKANTVVISSAGQMGRGSSVTIDGTDDNDDAVGGMLLNLPEDAVQEFQIATNRFSAETGRSGSGVVNVVTKSGSNSLHGSASAYERDKSLQALPATFDPTSVPGQTPPFSRQQYAGTLGGPLVKDRAWWFGGFEYRDELGGVLVGTRNLTTRTIDRSFASSPLNDLLGTVRSDWQVSTKDELSTRYSIERQSATGASTLNTSIGSASERQDLRNNFQSFLSSWTRVQPTPVEQVQLQREQLLQQHRPGDAGATARFPQHHRWGILPGAAADHAKPSAMG